MKVVYMGTPDFAVRALEAIVKEGHDVVACYTQPDKPKGRSGKMIPSEVKVKALELGIPVYQPVKIREAENVDFIKEINPDIIVVAAYGQILSEDILNIPRLGCINIHASLLPKLRGAAPIERAIINGDKETGVTTMYMAKGVDTGDMIDKVALPIEDTDTGVTLREKLTVKGAELIIETMKKLEEGTAVRIPQNDEESTHAPMLSKELGNIDFTKSAEEIERLIRGLNPWPCAYTKIDGKSVKIYGAKICEESGNPGEIIEVTKKTFKIACGTGSIMITSLQPEGKKQMDTVSYLNGNKITAGMVAGE